MLGIGQSLGNYRIVAKLGHGAMGVVYEAEHERGERVALKVIHKELSRNREVVTRFVNEARAINQIGNQHVVDISDFGQTDEGEPFMVMEVLAGESLATRLEREHRLPVATALHVAAQVADGLAAAHAAGVIHRDLKPDNVFLVERAGDPDFVKILDFGLAKLIVDGGVSVTKEGVILGTPEYMSPEQAESKRTIDRRSDVYALGILLYQMTTGLLPFVGGTMGEVLVKHVSRAPAPPRSVDPALPEAVERIILRCLHKRPEDRFQSMPELRAALVETEWALAPRGPAAPVATGSVRFVSMAPPRRWWHVRTLRWAAFASVATLALASGFLLGRRGGHARQPAPAEAAGAASSGATLPAPSVRVVINTNPPGAEILDAASGARLGVSPAQLSLPRGTGDRSLVIRRAGYAEKRRSVGTSGDAELTLDLDPAP